MDKDYINDKYQVNIKRRPFKNKRIAVILLCESIYVFSMKILLPIAE